MSFTEVRDAAGALEPKLKGKLFLGKEEKEKKGGGATTNIPGPEDVKLFNNLFGEGNTSLHRWIKHMASFSEEEREAWGPPPLSDHLKTQLQLVGKAIAGAKNVMFITGAGISLDSGIPTYRGAGGLYTGGKLTEEGLPIEMVLSGENMDTNPEVCWRYEYAIGNRVLCAKPNPGHLAIAKLRALFAQCGDDDGPSTREVCVMTQNVDGLHRKAFAAHPAKGRPTLAPHELIEIHGESATFRCKDCNKGVIVRSDDGWEVVSSTPSSSGGQIPWWATYASPPNNSTDETTIIPGSTSSHAEVRGNRPKHEVCAYSRTRRNRAARLHEAVWQDCLTIPSNWQNPEDSAHTPRCEGTDPSTKCAPTFVRGDTRNVVPHEAKLDSRGPPATPTVTLLADEPCETKQRPAERWT